YERVIHGHLGGRPVAADPDVGAAVVAFVAELARSGDLPVLHDVSDGGMAVAVAEICIASGVGASVEVDDWRSLFSEAPHRVLVAAEPETVPPILGAAEHAGVPMTRVGVIEGSTISLSGTATQVGLDEASTTYFRALRRRME
ncbi:MAG: AIR synthase-related protein, partial [Acidimicrobiia bacterium]|nr:AIR synthase-related protein [Acidimicrobiia bacterium]